MYFLDLLVFAVAVLHTTTTVVMCGYLSYCHVPVSLKQSGPSPLSLVLSVHRLLLFGLESSEQIEPGRIIFILLHVSVLLCTRTPSLMSRILWIPIGALGSAFLLIKFTN